MVKTFKIFQHLKNLTNILLHVTNHSNRYMYLKKKTTVLKHYLVYRLLSIQSMNAKR